MNILDYYGDNRPQPRKVTPEVVTPSQAVASIKADALALFREDPAALKSSALDVLNITVRPVETPEAATKLADQRAQVKTLLKNIEARRKQIVEPLKKEASAVDAEARTWSDPLKAWDLSAERVLLAFQRKQADDARREEENRQQALRDAAKKQEQAEILGNTEAAAAASTEIMLAEAQAPIEPIKGFKTDAGTTSLRKTWKVEVISPEDVPPAYLIPDLKRLQAAVDAGAREIEGCNIFEHESLPVRTR
jgi:hypothetical protein